jgi:hypothetical protein
MKVAVRPILGVIFSLALVIAAACGSSTPASSSNSSPAESGSSAGNLDPQVSMASGFPSDVPIYPGARLTAGASIKTGGMIDWDMTWETVDGADKVQAFYTAHFNQGDWTISSSGTIADGSFSLIFIRKSNSNAGGNVGVANSNGITMITLKMANGLT